MKTPLSSRSFVAVRVMVLSVIGSWLAAKAWQSRKRLMSFSSGSDGDHAVWSFWVLWSRSSSVMLP